MCHPKNTLLQGKTRSRAKVTNWQLTRHDQCHRFCDRLRVRVIRVHERHRCPGRGIFVLDPHTGLASLLTKSEPRSEGSSGVCGYVTYPLALAPTAICPLLAHEEVARPVRRLACLVRFTNEGKTLQGEHRRVGKANTPRAHPAAFGLLSGM